MQLLDITDPVELSAVQLAVEQAHRVSLDNAKNIGTEVGSALGRALGSKKKRGR